MTSQGTAYGRFQRALDRRNVYAADLAARELGRLTLKDAYRLVRLYAEADDPRFDRAAVRWLGRYSLEAEPTFTELRERLVELSRARAAGF